MLVSVYVSRTPFPSESATCRSDRGAVIVAAAMATAVAVTEEADAIPTAAVEEDILDVAAVAIREALSVILLSLARVRVAVLAVVADLVLRLLVLQRFWCFFIYITTLLSVKISISTHLKL